MKRILTFLTFFCCPIFSQLEVPSVELIVQTLNTEEFDEIRFELTPASTILCTYTGCDPINYNTIESYSVTLNEDELCQSNGFNFRGCNELNNKGYSSCDGYPQNEQTEYMPLRIALYKLNIFKNDVLQFSMYYDNRDQQYMNSNCMANSCNEGNDVTLRYIANINKVYFYKNPNNNPELNPTKEINNDERLIYSLEMDCDDWYFGYIWDSQGLVVVPKYNSSTGQYNPRLVWGPYQDTPIGSILGYRIYKASNHSPGNPGTFTEYTVVDDEIFEYVDVSETMGQYYTANSYYVVLAYEDPWDTPQETSPTNTVEVREAYPQKEKVHDERIGDIQDFNLFQNYPNPFNPSTSISFSIQTKGKVLLKVFDVLGNEIETLADGEYEPGIYNINFNAQNLSSGIYFCTIVTNEFRKTNKMILAK